MKPETKSCQNCKNEFTIEPDDFTFYEKIKVPPPTFCPECRMIRRFSWRNERTLHRAKCAATGKNIISGFHPAAGYTIYDRDYWWSDSWDPMSYGTDYDFSKPFFQQFDELMHRVPHPAVFNGRTVNCDYTNHTGESKNGYLVSASWETEDCTYCSRIMSSKDCLDCYAVYHGELCYGDIVSTRLSQTVFSEHSDNCVGSAFLYDCKNCTDCFGCTNLRNKSYCIFNQQYTKEEYNRLVKSEWDLGSHSNLEKATARFRDLKLNSVHRYAHLVNCQKTTGDNVANAFNCYACFDFIDDVRDCKWCINGGLKMSDSYDGYGVGANAQLLYETLDAGVDGQRFLSCAVVWGGVDLRYLFNSFACQDCFGCVGLRNKSYCILNKQYSKEEYKELLPKIIDQMTKAGEYGEFFPSAISPFGYNETIAQDYLPLTKDEALKRGYKWRDRETPKYQPTVKTSDLPDHIKDVDEKILQEIIECATCKRPYRILKRELDFLKRFNIALPRSCFECRHLARFYQVNFPRLYQRQCAKCSKDIETTYSPDRKELVYCEQCYNAEVV